MTHLWAFAALLMTTVASVSASEGVGDIRARSVAAPVSMQGTRILSYELPLGVADDQAELHGLCVIDGASGERLAVFEGADLAQRVAPLHALPATTTANPPAVQGRIAFIEIALRADQQPQQLRHQFDCGQARARDVGPTLAVSKIQPVVLSSPLGTGSWVAVHQPDWPRGHRRVFYSNGQAIHLPGRFAIDFVGVDRAGRTSTGDPDDPRKAIGYGSPVSAVADARVVVAQDGVAESRSIRGNAAHRPEQAAGNHVVLELQDGQFAFYEHLKPGSITVKRGDTVRRGQVIGALGFSGDSTGPHLHFHIADGASPHEAEGLPFAFDHFRQLGRYADIGDLGGRLWSTTGSDMAADRTNEWPGYNAVIAFDAR